MKCAQCDTNEAAWEWPCILVSHSQTDLGSKVQVRQSVVGLGNAGLCPACEKKMSWAMAGIQMYACFGLVGSFFLFFLVLIAGDKLKISKGIQFAVVGVLFLVSAAILLGGRFVSDRHYQNKPMKKRARLLSDCKFRYYHYVPVGDKFYSSFENFRQVNSSVLYDLAEMIYKDLIKTDKWKEMTPGKRIGRR